MDMPSTESISAGSQGQKTSRQRKISLRTKLLFAAGTAQEATVTAGGIVTIIYYNQVLGLSPSLCGLAFMVAMIFDAVSDPLIGAISDNFKSRFGRRHPFMFFSAIPLALGFYLLYQPLAGLSETGLFIWLTGFSVVLRFGQTMYLVPHDALGAELTDDYDERSSIFGYNAVSQMILSMVFTGILYYLLFPTTPEYENGLMNEPRYLLLSVVGAVTIIFSILVCSLGTMNQIPFLHDVDFSSKFIIKGYLSEVVKLLKNPSYLAICGSMMTVYIALGIINVITPYAHLYVFEFTTEDMFWFGIAKLPGVFIAIPLLAVLSKRLEKKSIWMAVTIIVVTSCAIPFLFKMAGVFPAQGSGFDLLFLLSGIFFGFLFFPVASIVIDSQLSDVADDHEYRTGMRSEGVVFSIRSFAYKSTQGVGGLLAGIGLEIINFPDNAEAGNLTADTVMGLLFMCGPLYLVISAIGIFFMSYYSIDRKRHAEILTELEGRRAAVSNQKTDLA